MSLKFPIIGWDLYGKEILGKIDASYVYVVNLTAITTLTGGGASALDGIPTAGTDGVDLGTRVVIHHAASGADLEFLFVSSPGAEVVPWVILPDDYNAATNDRGWSLRKVHKDGLICAWDSSNNQKFYRLFVEPDANGTAILKPDTGNPFLISS